MSLHLAPAAITLQDSTDNLVTQLHFETGGLRAEGVGGIDVSLRGIAHGTSGNSAVNRLQLDQALLNANRGAVRKVMSWVHNSGTSRTVNPVENHRQLITRGVDIGVWVFQQNTWINPDDFSVFEKDETMQVYDIDSRNAYMVQPVSAGTKIVPNQPGSFRVERLISQTRHEVTTHVDAVIHTLHGLRTYLSSQNTTTKQHRLLFLATGDATVVVKAGIYTFSVEYLDTVSDAQLQQQLGLTEDFPPEWSFDHSLHVHSITDPGVVYTLTPLVPHMSATLQNRGSYRVKPTVYKVEYAIEGYTPQIDNIIPSQTSSQNIVGITAAVVASLVAAWNIDTANVFQSVTTMLTAQELLAQGTRIFLADRAVILQFREFEDPLAHFDVQHLRRGEDSPVMVLPNDARRYHAYTGRTFASVDEVYTPTTPVYTLQRPLQDMQDMGRVFTTPHPGVQVPRDIRWLLPRDHVTDHMLLSQFLCNPGDTVGSSKAGRLPASVLLPDMGYRNPTLEEFQNTMYLTKDPADNTRVILNWAFWLLIKTPSSYTPPWPFWNLTRWGSTTAHTATKPIDPTEWTLIDQIDGTMTQPARRFAAADTMSITLFRQINNTSPPSDWEATSVLALSAADHDNNTTPRGYILANAALLPLSRNHRALLHRSHVEAFGEPSNNRFSGALTVGGGVGIEGDLHAANVYADSDGRLKDNIDSISTEDALDRVRRLRPTRFTWKSKLRSPAIDCGFVAQEAMQVTPEAGKVDPESGLHSLNLQKIIPYLVGAVQALDGKVNRTRHHRNGSPLRVGKRTRR
jgi:hypothetical protein